MSMLGDWKRKRAGGGGGRAVKSIVHTVLKLQVFFFFCQKPCVEGGI